MKIPPPKRRVTVTLEGHANDHTALADMLYDLAARLDAGEWKSSTEMLEGGPRSGCHLQITVNDEMTAERYQQELDAWQLAKHTESATDTTTQLVLAP